MNRMPQRTMPIPTTERRRTVAWALLALATALASAPAAAAFICDNPPLVDAERFEGGCFWTQKQAPLAADLFGKNWPIKIRETTDVRNNPKLLLELQHDAAPHAEVDEKPALRQPFVWDTGSFPPGATGQGLRVLTHTRKASSNEPAHFDIYRYEVFNQTRDPMRPPLVVSVLGDHKTKQGNYRWSYSNSNVQPGKLTVWEILVGEEKKIVADRKLEPDERAKGDLSDKARGVRIQFIVGDPVTTESTLGFVEGQPGEFALADLALLALYFRNQDEFFIPMLYDKDELLDLFVAVDLARWLPAGLSPMPGDEYLIQSGIHPLLPGFLVSTTPIQFDPALGFTTANRVNNLRVVVGGMMDGQVVPEPATLTLILCGLAALRAVARPLRSSRRPAALHTDNTQ